MKRVRHLLKLLGNPQDSFPSIHVVGTNGKGSTVAFLSSILQEHGLKTGNYTSPHLVEITERLVINGERIPENRWEKAAEDVTWLVRNDRFLQNDPPSFFENLTATAFLLLKEEEVDIAVVEAGMGGRLDATNLLGRVLLSVITPIALDHSEYLGNSLTEIAMEKFAVIRENNRALFCGNESGLEQIFLRVCKERNTKGAIFSKTWDIQNPSISIEGCNFDLKGPDLYLQDLKTPMVGHFQMLNSSMAIASFYMIRDEMQLYLESSIRKALEVTFWPGRFEILHRKPPFILDGAHNPGGMENLVMSLKDVLSDDHKKNLAVVFTSMKDKDFQESLRILKTIRPALYCCSLPDNSRCASSETLRLAAHALDWPVLPIHTFDDPLDAISEARKSSSALVVCGSLYLGGYVKARLADAKELA